MLGPGDPAATTSAAAKINNAAGSTRTLLPNRQCVARQPLFRDSTPRESRDHHPGNIHGKSVCPYQRS
jgi:hypothetical protein